MLSQSHIFIHCHCNSQVFALSSKVTSCSTFVHLSCAHQHTLDIFQKKRNKIDNNLFIRKSQTGFLTSLVCFAKNKCDQASTRVNNTASPSIHLSDWLILVKKGYRGDRCIHWTTNTEEQLSEDHWHFSEEKREHINSVTLRAATEDETNQSTHTQQHTHTA